MQCGTNVDNAETESEFEPTLGSVTCWVSSLVAKDMALFVSLSIVNDLDFYRVLLETSQTETSSP